MFSYLSLNFGLVFLLAGVRNQWKRVEGTEVEQVGGAGAGEGLEVG